MCQLLFSYFPIFPFLFPYFGEKPGRIIYSALTVIVVSAILYYGVGIEACVIEENSLQVVNVSYSSQLTVHENFENLVTCSYFSVVTFTTMGYGNLHPAGVSRIIAMVEAPAGVFMLALFALTMGRKMMLGGKGFTLEKAFIKLERPRP